MSVVTELITVGEGGLLSFGDYTLTAKKKKNDFEVKGDVYKIKTFKEVTKLEKNENLLFEAVPGAAVHNFSMNEQEIKFDIEGYEDTQIILELESSTEYNVTVGKSNLGNVKTTVSGKLVFSAELGSDSVNVLISKV